MNSNHWINILSHHFFIIVLVDLNILLRPKCIILLSLNTTVIPLLRRTTFPDFLEISHFPYQNIKEDLYTDNPFLPQLKG